MSSVSDIKLIRTDFFFFFFKNRFIKKSPMYINHYKYKKTSVTNRCLITSTLILIKRTKVGKSSQEDKSRYLNAEGSRKQIPRTEALDHAAQTKA